MTVYCVVSYASDQRSHDGDGQTAKKDDDAVTTRGKKRTPSYVQGRSNKCSRADVSASDVAAADDDGDDGIDRCDVESSAEVRRSADDAQPEVTNNSPSNATDTDALTPEVDSLPVGPLSTEVLHESETPTSDPVALTASICRTTDDVTITSELPLTVMSSSSYSAAPRSSDSHCLAVATTANAYRDDKDVTATSSKLLPVASLTAKTACSGTPTFVSSGTSTVSAVVRLPEVSMLSLIHI